MRNGNQDDFENRNPGPGPAPPPSYYVRRNLREARELRRWTKKDLAKKMVSAGTPMTESQLSKIEHGVPPRRVTIDELYVFAYVLEMPLIRLLTPPDALVGEFEADVRVTNTRYMSSIEARNWIVYGDAATANARSAQLMMRLAYCAISVQRERGSRQVEAKAKLRHLISEVEAQLG